MSASPPQKPKHSPDQFVDREEALDLVLSKARRMAVGETVEQRAVFFLGQRGAGKTWILHELEYRLQDQPYEQFECRLIGLNPVTNVEVIRGRIPAQRPLVLLFDDVSEASDSWMDQFEERILAPLAQDSDILLVLTQRGRPHVWKAMELREKAHDFTLAPFTREWIEEQVRHQAPAHRVSVDEIERLSGGFPWSTYLLATHLPESNALDECADLFLQDVDPHLYSYFDALSVLKAFDETRMDPICGAFSPALAAETRTYGGCRRVREQLLDTTLARWEPDMRGYILDEPLRLVLEARLLEHNPGLWLELHCVAYRLYDAWATKYSKSAKWWTQEKKYHERRMAQVGYDTARCLEEEEEGENDNAG